MAESVEQVTAPGGAVIDFAEIGAAEREAVSLNAEELDTEITNFDLKDSKQAWQYVNAATGGAERLVKHRGDEIAIVGFVLRPIVFQSRKDGSFIRTARTVILDANGQQWATSSAVAARPFIALHKAGLARKVFNPPLIAEITRPQCKEGETINLTFRVPASPVAGSVG